MKSLETIQALFAERRASYSLPQALYLDPAAYEFDLEAVFIVLWAVAGRELGWAGYREVLIFIGVLTATLAYLWRTGALDWYPAGYHAKRRI